MRLVSWLLGVVFLLSLVLFLFVLFHFSPYKDFERGVFLENISFLAVSLFFISLFFLITSFFTLFFLFIRKSRRKKRKEKNFFQVKTNLKLSFRQGVLVALLVVVLLVMQALRILVWWDGLLALAAILLIELIFSSLDEKIRFN